MFTKTVEKYKDKDLNHYLTSRYLSWTRNLGRSGPVSNGDTSNPFFELGRLGVEECTFCLYYYCPNYDLSYYPLRTVSLICP